MIPGKVRSEYTIRYLICFLNIVILIYRFYPAIQFSRVSKEIEIDLLLSFFLLGRPFYFRSSNQACISMYFY